MLAVPLVTTFANCLLRSAVVVPRSNYDAHTVFCQRHRARCTTCGKVRP
jgi:hypothetical protein